MAEEQPVQTVKLAVIRGDGIGPEVVDEALKVLHAVLPDDLVVEETAFSLGAGRYLETGDVLTEDDMSAIAEHDAILLGAVGGDPRDPRLAGGIIERGLLLKLRFAFDHYVNLRPTKVYSVGSPLAEPARSTSWSSAKAPRVRTSATAGRSASAPHEIATEVSLNTAHGVERVVRYAFDLASRRTRRHLTLVHKSNVLVNAGALWQRTVAAVGTEYPDVTVDYQHVDAVTIHMVREPGRFDVIVTDNLFGDIITDLAGAISGGIGLAASGNINPDGTFPSMFEPVHGSAPDIAGQQLADPTAAVLSVALLLDHLGRPDLAAAVTQAVEADLADRGTTQRRTSEIGDAIAAAATARTTTA